jgi:hypothetical protein
MELTKEMHQYQWIINEGLLRDEGTLYGIAGAGIEEKIEAIHDYYQIKMAPDHVKVEFLEKKISGIQEQAPLTTEALSIPKPSTSINLLPIALQLIAYSGICYFNYWLLTYWLSPIIHSLFICIGLYLFGLFSVFIGKSILYNTETSLKEDTENKVNRENWKIYFEEVGVPLTVSMVIAILPARAYRIEFSIIMAIFFFMLFLLGGKGLINTLFRIGTQASDISQHIGQSRQKKRKKKELLDLRTELQSSTISLEELKGEENYRIKVFTSEYKLAFEGRQLANQAVVKKLA